MLKAIKSISLSLSLSLSLSFSLSLSHRLIVVGVGLATRYPPDRHHHLSGDVRATGGRQGDVCQSLSKHFPGGIGGKGKVSFVCKIIFCLQMKNTCIKLFINYFLYKINVDKGKVKAFIYKTVEIVITCI